MKEKERFEYSGWHIVKTKYAWVANQYGVAMNTNTKEGIKRMVDQKEWLRIQERK